MGPLSLGQKLEFFFTSLVFSDVRQLTLYSTDDGSRQGVLVNVGGKKIKIKVLGQLVSEERKIKQEKLSDSK